MRETIAAIYSAGDTADRSGNVSWTEVKRDDIAFKKFLGDVPDILDLPEPPPHSSECGWCKYRDDSKLSGL